MVGCFSLITVHCLFAFDLMIISLCYSCSYLIRSKRNQYTLSIITSFGLEVSHELEAILITFFLLREPPWQRILLKGYIGALVPALAKIMTEKQQK